MTRFEILPRALYIDGHRVLKAWESWQGWHWFAVEKVEDRTLHKDGKEVKDTIWFGLVRGLEDEWGYFSEAELRELMDRGLVWEVKPTDIYFAGRRD